jgi:tRNA G18 (ribose-2'-O)-methylase SpoU
VSHFIESLDDPRLEPYRDLRNRNPTRLGHYFIAEGRLVVERVLQGRYPLVSILLEEGRELLIEEERFERLILPRGLMRQLVGFDFHRGVLACGLRKPLVNVREMSSLGSDEIVLCAAAVQDPTNLANMIRSASVMGIQKVIVTPTTADPLSRRVLRVSMGHAATSELYQSHDLPSDLKWLHENRGVISAAATLSPTATPLDEYAVRGPTVVVFGNEGQGLTEQIEVACSDRITIPMAPGMDSLNVAVATGILIYQLRRSTTHGGLADTRPEGC